ncbi:MFS transporter [Anaerocolumna xylanovorans]|uniref:Fucose permease n=1 Tax=Anaerocolumna xylanovorans DSM 12503 TaxID=1121345 RepID=A0A1M7YDS7_9FIRM|nr:MFS transporter [Anaerocolumna xylanovorans]SHO50792.1 Fucose permease [Anaerocolumna xylanovorans DSM 12503]
MTLLLLIIIYLAFISLGLPDSLLGSSWPAIQPMLHVPVSYAGIVTMIVSGGTIVSSYFSSAIIKKLGTGLVTAISVIMTALALLGFAYSGNFLWFCILAVPLGLGAGSVDAALNNFVALHYEARHMSWLHCFWGVGATLGPVIMAYFLKQEGRWDMGYRTIGFIQLGLSIILFLSLPLWTKVRKEAETEKEENNTELSRSEILKKKGVLSALFAFFCYCAIESTAGLWGSSFLVFSKGITAETAAKWVSLFYLGITAGRFLAGFLTMKFDNRTMIRTGEGIILFGILLLFLPGGRLTLMAGLLFMGFGCAPIYPSMIHETPRRFGKVISQSLMGMQMACAYIGATFMPPLFGAIANATTFLLYPAVLLLFLCMMVILSERSTHAVTEG